MDRNFKLTDSTGSLIWGDREPVVGTSQGSQVCQPRLQKGSNHAFGIIRVFP